MARKSYPTDLTDDDAVMGKFPLVDIKRTSVHHKMIVHSPTLAKQQFQGLEK